jgi:translation initiation factor 1
MNKLQETITVTEEPRKWGKPYTIINGVNRNGKQVCTKLKKIYACGGTYKKGAIMLQGSHSLYMKDALIGLGFDGTNIIVL